MKRCDPQHLNNDKYFWLDELTHPQQQALRHIWQYGDADDYYPQTIAKLLDKNLITEVAKNDYELTRMGEVANKQILAKELANLTGQI